MLSERGVRAWTWMKHEGLELTNHASELAWRGSVTQRKISDRSKNDVWRAWMQMLWSPLETSKRLKVSIWDVVEQSLRAYRLGRPPQPPALACLRHP